MMTGNLKIDRQIVAALVETATKAELRARWIEHHMAGRWVLDPQVSDQHDRCLTQAEEALGMLRYIQTGDRVAIKLPSFTALDPERFERYNWDGRPAEQIDLPRMFL